eukprot:TRINITY_DN8651_c0_g1_i1.p5 TRINITY_DN8651_c0_g1~~TRINITY_DN8651_c0_g1_i1.p5  ORF type:complete len:110 (+),score=20.88 TRINITY_DN8651_c0_g1_i1:639-968(+)
MKGRAGLARLLEFYRLPSPSKERVVQAMSENRELWRHRPLPAFLIEYAASDVRQLLALRGKLAERLGPRGVKIAMEGSRLQAEAVLSGAEKTPGPGWDPWLVAVLSQRA